MYRIYAKDKRRQGVERVTPDLNLPRLRVAGVRIKGSAPTVRDALLLFVTPLDGNRLWQFRYEGNQPQFDEYEDAIYESLGSLRP